MIGVNNVGKYKMTIPGTKERVYYDQLKADAKAGKPNKHLLLNNLALTMAGDLCIGMTHNKTWSYYSCTYTQAGGVRDFAGSRSWSLSGVSNDGFSDLDLSTVSLGVRII